MKTIGIVGTRRKNEIWHYRTVEKEFLKHYQPGDRICSGLCEKGADNFAVSLANIYTPNTDPLWFPAEWSRYGKSAGFKRNTDIAQNSDILIAMVADDRKSGTEDTIKKFIKFHGEENLHII